MHMLVSQNPLHHAFSNHEVDLLILDYPKNFSINPYLSAERPSFILPEKHYKGFESLCQNQVLLRWSNNNKHMHEVTNICVR